MPRIELDEGLQLSDKEFSLISKLVYEQFGINLTDKKRALVKGRLNKVVRSQGFASFGDYYKAVVSDKSGRRLAELVDRISTNYSYFFRESEHFSFMMEHSLPAVQRRLEAARDRDLRIWCAGCATGEEPYTIAMVLCEFFGGEMANWDVGILATDISVEALETARRGEYNAERVKAIPPDLLRRYFRYRDRDGGVYEANDRIRSRVLFKRLNLMNDTYPFRGKFHFIFARNVMIYFDTDTRKPLIQRFHRYTHDGGMLFIGHSETLGRDSKLFRYIQPAVYEKC